MEKRLEEKRMGKFFGAVCIVLLVGVLTGGVLFYLHPIWFADQVTRIHLRQQNVQSKYFDVDGYKIHYFEALPPARLRAIDDGTPLLLVHGLGSRGEDWAALIPTLAAHGFHVYAPDLIGYGRSSKPDVDYSISLEEKTVVDFMKAVHLDQVDLGGWSMGGWVALKLTVDHPELVRRLVVYDSAGIYFPPTFEASLFTPDDPAGVRRLTEMLSPHPKPMPAFVADSAVRRLRQGGWVIRRAVRSMEAGKDLLDFRLQLVQRPTLIVWGGDDKLIPLSAGESMHQKIANSSLLIVEGCGHLAPAECSKPVLQGTLQFLESHPAPAGGEMSVPGGEK